MRPASPEQFGHYVYFLRCANGSIYVGQTHDLDARIDRHRTGTGARHTAGIKPVEVIYQEGPMPFQDAVARERQLKKWSRAKITRIGNGRL